MRIVTGLFDTRDQAEEAVEALRDANIADEDITLIGPDGDADASGAADGAAVGATLGGVGGLLAGLGAFAIPGIGPVVGAGWLAATFIGAAAGGVAGGIIGALTDAGVDEKEAHVYAEGIRRGGTLVSARVGDELVDAAAAILRKSRSVNLTERRKEYVTAGWTKFDPTVDPWEPELEGRGAARPVIPPLPR